MSFTIQCATYDHKGQRLQDVQLRYQAAVSPSPLPYSQPLSLSPGIRQLKYC